MDTHTIEDKWMDRDYIFLSGPVKFETDGGHTWRDEVFRYARACDWYMRVFDPTDYFDYAWSDPFTKSDKQIREFYYEAIRSARLILVNLNNTDKSVGTGMEIAYANCKGKTIIGFGTTNVYNWVQDLCTVSFDDLATALDYITTYYDFDYGRKEDL